MHDLVVVGGGYWGVATTLLAEQQGLRVLLVNQHRDDSASRNASGYFAQGWYKGAWEQRALRGLYHAEKYGIVARNTGARIVANKGERFRQDWWTFSPSKFLSVRAPDVQGEVTTVQSGGVTVNDVLRPAKAVVVACGAWTDSLLTRSGFAPLGVTPLYGTGVILEGADDWSGVLLREINPYRQVAVREWGPKRLRVCATLETDPAKHESYVTAMMSKVQDRVSGWREVARLRGARPVCSTGPTVKEVAPGVIAASGGGRIGGMLAWWAAETVLGLARARA